MPDRILTGKARRNPASAIGVQNMKNDHVRSVTNMPVLVPSLTDMYMK